MLLLARAQGLQPGARAVSASLAACVGGGHWRRAVPTVEKMLEASGAQAWDEVMEFLGNARLEKLGRGLREGVGGRAGEAGEVVMVPGAASKSRSVVVLDSPAMVGGRRPTDGKLPRWSGDCGRQDEVAKEYRRREKAGGRRVAKRKSWGKAAFGGWTAWATNEEPVAMVNRARGFDGDGLTESSSSRSSSCSEGTLEAVATDVKIDARIQRISLEADVGVPLEEDLGDRPCEDEHLGGSDSSSAQVHHRVVEPPPSNGQNRQQTQKQRNQLQHLGNKHYRNGVANGGRNGKAAREAAIASTPGLRLGCAGALRTLS